MEEFLNDRLMNPQYEFIEGVKVMSPSGTSEHNTLICNLVITIGNYLWDKKTGRYFADNLDVHFPDGNILQPDFKVVLDPSIVRRHGTIYGVPDLCVEVLSKSTAKRDIGVKKDIYERNGVREYWIIDPRNKSITVYHLIEGKYVLYDVYTVYSTEEWDELSDQQRAEAKFKIKVTLFDDLEVDVHDVFRWID